MAALPKTCSVPDCNNAANKAGGGARGLCRRHYVRLQRHGASTGGATPKGAVIAFMTNVAIPHDGSECLAWPFSRDPQGYPSVRVDGQTHHATRIICTERHGPPPSPDHHAAHSCGKGHEGCCSAGHLFWKTASDNQMDRVEHGTSNRGERNHFCTLNECDVREIRRLHNVVPQAEIASRYGVAKTTIQAIHYRRSWAWLE